MLQNKFRVRSSQLTWHCDPNIFDFESTKDLEPLSQFIGQDRAIKALEFGLSMNYEGYNIYVAGLTGTGKTSAVQTHINSLLEKKQKKLIAFLGPYYHKKYGYVTTGTYGIELSPDGSYLVIQMNGGFGANPHKSRFQQTAIFVVHIPESEREE